MIVYVPFEKLNAEHLRRMVLSLEAAPEVVRPDAMDYLRSLSTGDLQLYEFDGGVLLLSKLASRLVLNACCCDNMLKSAVPLADDLKRLAAEWECDTIETTVFDRRLASAICKLGGHVESQTVVLPVE